MVIYKILKKAIQKILEVCFSGNFYKLKYCKKNGKTWQHGFDKKFEEPLPNTYLEFIFHLLETISILEK